MKWTCRNPVIFSQKACKITLPCGNSLACLEESNTHFAAQRMSETVPKNQEQGDRLKEPQRIADNATIQQSQKKPTIMNNGGLFKKWIKV